MLDQELLVLRTIERYGPIPTSDIAWLTIMSRREVEEAVQALRLAGRPIIAGAAGLSLAQTSDEVRAWLDSNDGRIRSMLATRRAMKRARRMLALTEQSYSPESGFFGDAA